MILYHQGSPENHPSAHENSPANFKQILVLLHLQLCKCWGHFLKTEQKKAGLLGEPTPKAHPPNHLGSVVSGCLLP